MPSKKTKAAQQDEQELREEAMAEWLARGHPMDEFSMEKMLKLWVEEDDGEDDDEIDSLEEKQELMRGLQVLGPIVDQAKDTAQHLSETVRREAKQVVAAVRKHAELPPLRRRRLLREHVVDVRTMDAETRKYSRIRQRVVNEFEDAKRTEAEVQFGLKKRNARRAPLLHRSRELKEEADHEEHVRKMNEIERVRQDRFEKEQNIKKERQEERQRHVEEQLVTRRNLSMTFWQKHLEDARKFSAQQTLERDRKEQFDRAVSEVQDEIRRVEGEEEVDAALGHERHETDAGLGVFGTNFEPGEWESNIDGGYQTGTDEHTIGIFSARGFMIENERTRNEHLEAQSKVIIMEEKLQQVEMAKATLGQERATIAEHRGHLVQQIQLVAQEYDDLNILLAGPPRRDPKEHEKLHFHALVTRRATIMEQLKQIECQQRNLDKKSEIVSRSEAKFSALLAQARDREVQLQQELDRMTGDRHDLPMVVGKTIFKSDESRRDEDIDASDSVTKQFGDPRKLLEQVTMESKLRILQNSALPANEHSKKSRNAIVDRWKAAELRKLAEQDLEAAQTRLANMHDRLLDHQAMTRQSDLMLAIQRFHQGPHKLRRTIFPVKGQIDWWACRNVTKTTGMELVKDFAGARLRPGESIGKLVGSVRFPKRGSYRVEFAVVSSSPYEPSAVGSNADDTGEEDNTERVSKPIDEWKLFIGSDYDSLQLQSFCDPSGTRIQTGDVLFEFAGSRFCFCFEFMQRRAEAGHRGVIREYAHLLSPSGHFEERLDDFREEDSRMQLIQREDHFVSEMVKMLRQQKQQTRNERCAELLQELISVENSHAKTWDSKLFHGHEQRFQRTNYVHMLRTEIKKEIGNQLDSEIKSRKAQHNQSKSLWRGGTFDPSTDGSGRSEHMEASRLDFQDRKSAFIQPHAASAKHSLGLYCSFKASSSNTDPARRSNLSPGKTRATVADTSSYGTAGMVVGIRYEWREARTKVLTQQKLCDVNDGASHDQRNETTHTSWTAIDEENAVYLGSACAKALQARRNQAAQELELATKTNETIEKVQQQTRDIRLEDDRVQLREAQEDENRKKQMERDLARREQLFYADGMRQATYNEHVSAQIDFRVQRALNTITQDSATPHKSTEDVVRDEKERYARDFMAGRMQLVKKTWQRKDKRIEDRRTRERKEREFRILQEEQLITEIQRSNQQELVLLEAEHEARSKRQLVIPNFQLAVGGAFPCEHLVLKAWSSKYGFGQKCKACGKEMASSFDDPLQGRGADPELSEDVQRHRAETTSGVSVHFQDSKHLEEIENERVRLEKEARTLEEAEGMLYDREAPKDMDALDYRHGLNRKEVLDNVRGDDPLYPRLVHEIHRASFQDEVLFHGRLRNFHFRIQQINGQHARYTTLLAVQLDFLRRAELQNKTLCDKLPLIEQDYERAVALLHEDAVALEASEVSKVKLTSAINEREAAHHAMEGVEDEAEFAEFHAPSLIKSSNEMAVICERVRADYEIAVAEADSNKAKFVALEIERENAFVQLRRLKYRTPQTLVRTRFGTATIQYFREEDNCVILSLLPWEGTVIIPIDELIAYEDVFCDEERKHMAIEDEHTRQSMLFELASEQRERVQMAQEERDIRRITVWRSKNELDIAKLRSVACMNELEAQLEYEMQGKASHTKTARREATSLLHVGVVVLGSRRRKRAGRFDLIRASRACEKRLGMAAVEQKLIRKNQELRQQSKDERDEIYASTLSAEILDDLVDSIRADIYHEGIRQEKHKLQESDRAFGRTVVMSEWFGDVLIPATTTYSAAIGLNRLWTSKKKKWALMSKTWRHEYEKLQILRGELASREEIRRLAEEERVRLERFQREMLAEERFCRQFYREEMVRCMQERKAMASAEVEMKEYLRQLELEAMKTKYSKMIDDRNQLNDKAARRLEIKLGKNEKHRLYREWTQIKAEDQLSMQIREEELAAAQAEALELQFDKFLVEQALKGRISAELEANRVAARLQEAQRVAAERRAQFESKLERERMTATVETFCNLTATELRWMDAKERAAYWEQKARALEANLKDMEPELDRIMDERKHVVTDASAKRVHADKCKARVAAADIALTSAIKRQHSCLQQFKHIHRRNATMDSSVLHNRIQLFNTSYLRDQLHDRYFQLLVEVIISQAIVISNERETTQLQTKMLNLIEEREFKTKEVKVLQRKRKRSYRMRLRRAELCKLMFGRSRRRILSERFHQWVELWSRRTVVRASFELKHSLLLQQTRLTPTKTAQFESMLTKQERHESKTKLSVLHRHQKRRLMCRLCKMQYSEEQNNRYACAYHPGTYEFACVRTCPTRRTPTDISATVAISPECMMHRAKRWLCCDETNEGRHGSTGCARRFHLPVRDEPALDELVNEKSNREQSLLDQVNQQLLELRERDLVGKARLATKSALTKIEHDLAQKRAAAAKYHTLDHRR